MLPDGCRDDLVPEAEGLDQHQEDAHPQALGAWDAWDGARRDAADAAGLRLEPADEDAERSADRAQDVRAQDAWYLRETRLVQWERPVGAVELCIRDAVPSAARSYAAQGAAADPPLQAVQADAARVQEAGARLKR